MIEQEYKQKIQEAFAKQFPLVASGAIEIKAVGITPGERAKVAVFSSDPNVSPLETLIEDFDVLEKIEAEIGGAKIEIMLWVADPKSFIETALDPAMVESVTLDEATHTAQVHATPEDMARGENDANLKMAEALTGWKIELV